MQSILAALKAFLPTLISKALEAASSKKVWATVGTTALVTGTDDWKKQLATAAIGAAYVIAQGNVDAKK